MLAKYLSPISLAALSVSRRRSGGRLLLVVVVVVVHVVRVQVVIVPVIVLVFGILVCGMPPLSYCRGFFIRVSSNRKHSF